MWPTEVMPTKNGGHTYIGFYTIREPTILREGVVKPTQLTNFELLTDEDKEFFREGFAKMRYKLIVRE